VAGPGTGFGGTGRLHLPDEDAHLRNDSLVRQLGAAASQLLGAGVTLRFEPKPAVAGDTLHTRTQRQRSEQQSAAEASFLADPVVASVRGLDVVGTTEQLEHVATLIPSEWLAPAATGTPEQCVDAVMGQLDLGCSGVILHGATPAELAPIVDAYRTRRAS